MHITETIADFKPLRITSSAFAVGQTIPSLYTCDGKDINPPLHIEGIPEQARSLVLIVDDPDAPGKTWVHWVMWNIPITHNLNEDSVLGEQGWNDFDRIRWGGPCPPSGLHRYFFKVYALDTTLTLPPKTTKSDLEHAMDNHILAFGELMGVYNRVGL
jgi:Raf kinase inhibitor-like YbhB/YbcL family protein